MDMVANGSCPSSSRDCAHTVLAVYAPTTKLSLTPPHLAPQLGRYGRTPVHLFMQYNENVTAEVLALLNKINPEAVTGTDK